MRKYKVFDIVKYNGFLCKVLGTYETGVDEIQLLSIHVYQYEKAQELISIRSNDELLTEPSDDEIKYFGLPFQQVMECKLDEIKAMLTKLTNPQKL
jgi:hypothetical protein